MSHLCPSCHRHVISCYVISRRKSRDGHATNASLSTVEVASTRNQLTEIKHDHVRWLSRRLPIPYRISGIWSSLFFFRMLAQSYTPNISYPNPHSISWRAFHHGSPLTSSVPLDYPSWVPVQPYLSHLYKWLTPQDVSIYITISFIPVQMISPTGVFLEDSDVPPSARR